MELIYKDESYAIVGACFEVYNELGNGFDESIYHEALEIELTSRNIPFVSELPIRVRYKGGLLNKFFKADVVAHEKIIVELKAVKSLNDYHRQQVINYLKATGYRLGLLINFGAPEGLEYERVVL
jgi:GxxExxY protein